MDFVTAAAEPTSAHTGSSLLGTVAVVDMVGYSNIAKIVEENIDTSSVAKLNRQIQGFVNGSLQQVPDTRSYRIIAKTGDGAIVFFQNAEDAHHFAACLHRSAREHSSQCSEATAERWFRVGIAAGAVNVTSTLEQPPEYAGIAIANAVRLEASAKPGEIVVDANTFTQFSGETQKLYGIEEVIQGKHTERFRARRCCVTQAIQTRSLTQLFQRRPNMLAAGTLGLVSLLFSPLSIPAARERVRGILLSSSEKHIAVLPLDFTGEAPEIQALGDGLMDSLSGKLANLDPANQSLFVVPASEVRSRKVIDAASALREFGATIVVKGRFERSPEAAQLDLTVIDSRRNRAIGYVEENSPTGDLLALQDRAIKRLGRLMNISGGEVAQRDNRKGAATTAYEDYLAGLGYFERSDKPENIELAVKSLEKAVETDPNFALGFALLAQVYTMQSGLSSSPELLQKAENYGKQALKLDPRLPSAYVALGQIHELKGNHDLAIQEFHEAINLDPRDPEAIGGIANSYQNAGQNADAEAAYRKAAALRPNDWQGYNYLGNFYQDIGRPGDAVLQYNHALKLAPENSWVYTNLGITYMDFADPKMLDEAEKELKQSIAIDPNFIAYSYLGKLYAEKHRFQESVAANQAALRLNDKSSLPWCNLTMAYEWLKQDQQADFSRGKAIEILESHVKADPQDAEAQATLAALYAKIGESAKAREKIRISLALPSSSRYIYTRLADAYELLGERNESVASLQHAVRLGLNLGQIDGDPELQTVLTAVRGTQKVPK